LTSVSFERPPALSKDSPVPLPALIDDEYLSEIVEGQQPQNIPSRLGFFVYMIKLINIREKLPTDKVRNAPIGQKRFPGQDIDTTIQLLTELDRFVETLPSHLRADHASDHPRFVLPASRNDNCFKLQTRVIEAR
jgi:hypothetical protein